MISDKEIPLTVAACFSIILKCSFRLSDIGDNAGEEREKRKNFAAERKLSALCRRLIDTMRAEYELGGQTMRNKKWKNVKFSGAAGRRLMALLLAAGIAASASGCSADARATDEQPSQKETQTQSDAEQPNPGSQEEEEVDGIKEPELNEESEDSKDTVPPSETGPYDFSQSVPESAEVENSYFDDAVFIGNSRTEGFKLYSGLSNAQYYTAIGLMVDTIFTKPYATVDGEKTTIMEALKTTEFSKVYIMLGMNELGWVYGSVYQEYYGRIIDAIREINPDAVIYIQSILPVSAEKSESDQIYNNERINEFNSLLRELAEEKEVYYVDVAQAVSDENGCLPEDGSFDGVHLTPEYCGKWRDYLKTHTVTVECAD